MSTVASAAELVFPTDFVWGTAASATQAEGAGADSDWLAWERAGRAPASGDGNGFGTRFAEDFALLAEWGLLHHRLSLDWSRLEPTPGRFDQRAVEHYRAMLAAGREAGLTVWACLLHGALPSWFTAEGGFLHPEAAARWRRWVEFAAETFGDLVSGWKPVNGPASFATKRYLTGQFPPGVTDRTMFGRALRAIQVADFEAARLLRTTGRPTASVAALAPVIPGSEAARPAAKAFDGVLWDSWLGLARSDAYGDAFDYIGFSYYFAVEIGEAGQPRPYPPGRAVGPQGYVPWPEGLRLVLDRLAEELPGRRLLVSELGYGGSDDAARVEYLSQALAHVNAAMRDGVDVAGVFLWTGVDNYEWTDGYTVPFGLFTADRQPRGSADFVRNVIQRSRR
ncbi:glycoside hydrolase family 1 protein [Planosporangium thailandense]|uniref:Glycoside hydrolase family 1 protein n=1 Tax=Planosporangium thailandense TaxID=765197 RepID=A0ABX0XX90_9ACTN|nr:glycoside hydrolase family 1 protein [Planosporangium thailandense]